jgi:PAS domain S-box-containing protein
MSTAPIPLPESRGPWIAGNTVDVLTAVLLDGRPGDAAEARHMLDQLRLGLNASAAAVWVIADEHVTRALLVDDASAGDRVEAVVLDDAAIQAGQISGLEALAPDGVRSFVAAAGGRGVAIDGALILGWNTPAVPADQSVEPLLCLAAALLLQALRPAAGPPPDMPRAVVDSLPAGLVVLDRDGTTIAVNAAWWDVDVAHEPDAAGAGVDFLARLRGAAAEGNEDAPLVLASINAVCAGTLDRVEHTCRCDGLGKRRHILLKIARLRRPEGGAVVMLEDMTMESVEDVVRGLIEERFQRFADSVPAPIWMMAPDGRLLYGNQAWRDATGAEASQRAWTEAIHHDDLTSLEPVLRAAGDRRTGFHVELRLRGDDGGYRWWSFVGAPHYGPSGSLDVYVGTCTDATARRHAQQKVRALGGRLLAAQEAQRGRIARELHDDIGHQVALLASRLNAAARLRRPSSARLRQGIDDALDALRELATSIHNLSYELYPAKLRLLGLNQTLHALCRDVAAAAHVVVDCAQDGTAPDVPEDVALCLFRVAQEALQNAVKHSGARHIDVSLSTTGPQITLRVADRGTGFDPVALASNAALGLVTMRERVELIGGQLRIDTAPGRGTAIDAVVPIPHDDIR